MSSISNLQHPELDLQGDVGLSGWSRCLRMLLYCLGARHLALLTSVRITCLTCLGALKESSDISECLTSLENPDLPLLIFSFSVFQQSGNSNCSEYTPGLLNT